MKIIAGLGNPGKKYEKTKHNAGFMAIDFMVEKNGLSWKKNKKFNAEIAKDLNNIYIKPLTFMNNSGRSIEAVMSYYNLLPKTLGIVKKKNSDLTKSLILIHDDIDIDLGKYKTSKNSRSAGHNGVKSIINYLKTKNFRRIRIGIKTEDLKDIPTEKFVLSKFNKKELDIINSLIKNIAIL